jgi:hypothetical protein
MTGTRLRCGNAYANASSLSRDPDATRLSSSSVFASTSVSAMSASTRSNTSGSNIGFSQKFTLGRTSQLIPTYPRAH